MVDLGLIIPPDQPPERFHAAVLAAERGGLDDVWFWEDCFAESGLASAAAALAWTDRIRVGIGLMPVPLRNVALTAMEVATLARLFPGRFLPGLGHGVLDWMAQAGVRAQSPMTLLREQSVALRALLDGQRLSVQGRYVQLDDVQLRWAPEQLPPLLVGAVGPKTVALAGELGDGIILTGGTTPHQVSEAVRITTEASGERRQHRPEQRFAVVVFASVPAQASPTEIAAAVTPLVEAGATSVPILALSDDGPESGPAIVDFAERLAQARVLLR